MNWHNKKILVLGLGKTGLSMMHFLHNQCAELSAYDLHLSDDKRSELAQLFPYSSFYSGSLKQVLEHNHFDLLALSPGFSARLPEIQSFQEKGGQITGDIDILCSLIHGKRDKIVAITGSNGKSTVTELVGFLCRKSGLDTIVAGNIGLPVLDAYQVRDGQSADVWVLELSSFQLETTPYLSADAAACLNISEDHLDRYQSLLDYAHQKESIFQAALTQVLNGDDVFCRAMSRTGAECRYFSLQENGDYALSGDGLYLQKNQKNIFEINKIPLAGKHNIANVLAALALCEGLGLHAEKLCQWLPEFKGLAHRVEKIGEINGISFYDDSKGTNVGASLAALQGADAPVVLIAGGLAKGQDFNEWAKVAAKKCKKIMLIGQDAPLIQAALNAWAVHAAIYDDLPSATQAAFQAAIDGDWVLLSPACASMDMFRDYAHRAEVFIQSFKDLSDDRTA